MLFGQRVRLRSYQSELNSASTKGTVVLWNEPHGGSDTPLPTRSGKEPLLLGRRGFENTEVIGFKADLSANDEPEPQQRERMRPTESSDENQKCVETETWRLLAPAPKDVLASHQIAWGFIFPFTAGR